MSVNYLIENEPEEDVEVGDQCEFGTPDGPCPNTPIWKVTVTLYGKDDDEMGSDALDACTYHAEQVLQDLAGDDDSE